MKSGYNELTETGSETSSSREKSSVNSSAGDQLFLNVEQKDNFALTDSVDEESMPESELLFSAHAPPTLSKFNND